MAETKPLASLSPSLLARKGAARPAMRPQAYSFNTPSDHHNDDLGWNDMGHDETTHEVVALPGHDVPAVSESVAAPQVVQQQQDLAEKLAPAEEVKVPIMARAAPGSRNKAAFTLRLDAERHLKLRLLSALSHRSAQQIVTEALDAILNEHSDTISSANTFSAKG